MLPYIIKSFRGGISDEHDKGVKGSFKFGYALSIHSVDDILTAKQAMATVEETTVDGLVKFFVNTRDGSSYAFADNGDIYARANEGNWNLAYVDSNGAIKGAAEWQLSDGNNYLIWCTDTSISRKLFNGQPDLTWAGVEQNWKTTLDSADWHTMKNAGGVLNIANGNFLATIDYTGNFDPADLNVRPGNYLKCIDERDDYVLMGSERRDEAEEGHIWSWITTATNWVQKKLIPVKGVNALINTELMLLQGGSDGEIFFSDFINAVPLHGIPGGVQVNPGGVSIENDLAIFGFYGGTYPGLWTYGRKRKNRPFALNYDYRMAKGASGSTISEIGAVSMTNGTLLASWKTTDGSTIDYGVDSVSSTTKATAVYEGLEFDNGMPHLKKFFNTIKLNITPLVSGTSISVKYKTDKESAWRYAVLGSGSTTFSEADQIEAIFSIEKPGAVYEVGVELNPTSNNSPGVLAITSYLADDSYEY